MNSPSTDAPASVAPMASTKAVKDLEALLEAVLKHGKKAAPSGAVRARLEAAAVQAQVLHMTVLLGRPRAAALEAAGALSASLGEAVLFASKARVDQNSRVALQLAMNLARSISANIESAA